MANRALLIKSPRGELRAISARPRNAKALFVFAHGAGAGMNHRFMVEISAALEARGIATLRYEFPYMSAGRSFPDRAPVLEDCVRAAVAKGQALARGLPLFAGGKSMGGRMTSRAQAIDPLRGVRGIAFLGFPLYPAVKPEAATAKAAERSAHLAEVDIPMKFIQGTRDKLADLRRIRRLVTKLGENSSLHVVKDADHGFDVLVRSGRLPAEVRAELADSVSTFCLGLPSS